MWISGPGVSEAQAGTPPTPGSSCCTQGPGHGKGGTRTKPGGPGPPAAAHPGLHSRHQTVIPLAPSPTSPQRPGPAPGLGRQGGVTHCPKGRVSSGQLFLRNSPIYDFLLKTNTEQLISARSLEYAGTRDVFCVSVPTPAHPNLPLRATWQGQHAGWGPRNGSGQVAVQAEGSQPSAPGHRHRAGCGTCRV